MIDHLVNTDYKVVDKREPVSTVTGYLNGDTDTLPIVTDGDRPWGVINERSFMRTSVTLGQRVESYTVGTGTLSPQAPLAEVARFFANTPVPHVPIEENGRLIGYLSATDVLAEMPDGPTAVHLMEEVASLRDDMRMGEAVHLFRGVQPSYLPVVDHEGRITGVMDRKTVAQIGLHRSRDDGRIAAGGEVDRTVDLDVKGFMTDAVATVRPDAPWQETVRVLKEHGYAIVAKDGKPLGVITAHHALKNIAKT